jgi:hypothetical protein
MIEIWAKSWIIKLLTNKMSRETDTLLNLLTQSPDDLCEKHVLFLLDHMKDEDLQRELEKRDVDGRTVLGVAIYYGFSVKLIKRLIDVGGSRLKVYEEYNYGFDKTSIEVCIFGGQIDKHRIIHMLIINGCVGYGCLCEKHSLFCTRRDSLNRLHHGFRDLPLSCFKTLFEIKLKNNNSRCILGGLNSFANICKRSNRSLENYKHPSCSIEFTFVLDIMVEAGF